MTEKPSATLGRKAEVIRAEQEYFDVAYDFRSEAAEWLKNGSSGGTAVERRAFKAAAAKRPVVSADEPVAFGRMTTSDGESYYVGKVPIFDHEKNLLVMNWQAPAASAFNQASPSDPQGLAWKRTFNAPYNEIRDFDDLVFQEIAERLEALQTFSYGADELLQDVLSRKRTGEMADIVSTIQAAQDKLIRQDKDQLLVIQGGPGTGKTAVALHRVSWLLFNHQESMQPQDILIVGPNATFARYIRKVLPGLGDEDVVQQSLEAVLRGEIRVRGEEGDETAALKGSAPMAGLLNRAIRLRPRVPKDDVLVRRRNSATALRLSPQEAKLLFDGIKPIPYAEGRLHLRRRLVEACADRLGNARGIDPESLLDPASVEGAVERMWPQLTPAQLVRELYGSRDRLTKANKEFSHGELELLYRPMASRIADEPWTRADLAVVDLAQALMREVPQKYEHIVIDEAQDLSYMELVALRARSRNGSMTVVGDIAQSTGPHARDSWDPVIRALELGLIAQVAPLEHGYRVPKQAFDLAVPVLASAAPAVQPPLVLREVDHAPVWSLVPEDELGAAVAQAVIDRSRGYFVGIIAHPDHWEELRTKFRHEGLKWAESTSGELSGSINLVTPADAKGLEFDAVIVVDPQRIVEMPHGLRLLYIALTRTTTMLDLVIPAGRVPGVLRDLLPNGDGDRDAAADPFVDPSVAASEHAVPQTIARVADPFTVPELGDLPQSPSNATPAEETRLDESIPSRNTSHFEGLPPNLQAKVALWVDHYREELSESVGAKLIPAVVERLYVELASRHS
ncbi:HelD family protein [Sinomonas mesophila]|uniref:HelD family protein n=1 Tax=Sinomonas mesophila TaxID=1531955 RepID=UPI0015894E36|nr:AAA family ATPase [Sinomonas mesophila]